MKPLAFLTCGLMLAFGSLLLTEKYFGGHHNSRLTGGAYTGPQAHHLKDAGTELQDALAKNFLSQDEWTWVLSGASGDDLLQVIDRAPPGFWQAQPIAESSAYRIFGALGRIDTVDAVEQAIQTFSQPNPPKQTTETEIAGARREPAKVSERSLETQPSVEESSTSVSNFDLNLQEKRRISCLRWAILGIFENQKHPNIEDYFEKCPPELWRALIQGAIGGSNTGTISQDLQSLRTVFSRLLNPTVHKDAKAHYELLLTSAIDAWIQRDASAVLAFLMTKEGKAYSGMLPKVIAAMIAGKKDIEALLNDPSNVLKTEDIASACYQNGFQWTEVKSLVGKLPAPKRDEFLAGYAKALANGSPAALMQFVDGADSSLLTPAVAMLLGSGVFKTAPWLFGKLSMQLDPAQRDKLIDQSYKPGGYKLNLKEAATTYLEIRGPTGPSAVSAINDLATSDLPKALAFIPKAPREMQHEMLRVAYEAVIDDRIEKGDSVESVVVFAKSAPSEEKESAASTIIADLADKDPAKCLEVLKTHFAANPTVLEAVFNGRFQPLNINQMNDFLANEIKIGIPGSVYSSAAVAITSAIAANDITEATQVVNALKDPAVKEACTNAMVGTWSKSDPLNAFSYVAQLPMGVGRDAAITAVFPALRFAPDKREEILALASTDAARASIKALPDSPKNSSP